tara:strand:- start:237 stop:527 length:291 start_codon:yes stop_codon:yes gene_type:complete
MKQYHVYILQCSDDSFYTGITNNIDKRIEEHNSEDYPKSYVHKRRPVQLVWYASFTNPQAAINKEKQIKRWSRAKKQALIEENYLALQQFSKKRFG